MLIVMVSAEGKARATEVSRDADVETISLQNGLTHAIRAGDVIIGICEERHSLYYKLGALANIWIPYQFVRAIELTPIFRYDDEATSKTVTRRGSQLLSAGIGAVVAGPAGAIIGGVTSPRDTVSHTTAYKTLEELELKTWLKDPARPILVLGVSHRLPSGSFVPPYLGSTTQNFAARLACIVEDQAGTQDRSDKSVNFEPLSETLHFGEPPQTPQAQRGWLQRTFGS